MTRERLTASELERIAEVARLNGDGYVERIAAELSACWEERERLTAALRAVRKIKSDHKHHGCDEEVLDLVNEALKKGRVDALREPPAQTEAPRDESERCPIVVEYDDSIGGEGSIRCGAKGAFSDDSTSWTCSNGHITDESVENCRVDRCPCRALREPQEDAR